MSGPVRAAGEPIGILLRSGRRGRLARPPPHRFRWSGRMADRYYEMLAGAKCRELRRLRGLWRGFSAGARRATIPDFPLRRFAIGSPRPPIVPITGFVRGWGTYNLLSSGRQNPSRFAGCVSRRSTRNEGVGGLGHLSSGRWAGTTIRRESSPSQAEVPALQGMS